MRRHPSHVVDGRRKRILVVDDDLEWGGAMARALRANGYDVEQVATGGEALEATRRRGFDAILLDWGLPDAEGVAVCRWLRDLKSRGAIIMMTARNGAEDIVAALESGADDFVSKTDFRLEVALARIAAVLRRTSPASTEWRVGLLTVNEASRTLTIGVGGEDTESVRLTPTELRILSLLAARVGRVVSRQEIMQTLWGADADVSENAIETLVRRLRQKLGRAGSALETVRAAGYVLRAEA
jgi:two-component system OmpR family response regulator